MMRRLIRLLKRVSVYGHGHAWPRPEFTHVNEGRDWHFIAFGLSTPYGDSLVMVEVNLGDERK